MGKPKKAAAPEPPPVEEKPEPILCTVVWEGITINVSYKPKDIMAYAHLELRVQLPHKEIPVTETGYRSHFLPPGIVEEAGGPEAFVLAWLTEEAKTPQWKKRDAAARQLSLF